MNFKNKFRNKKIFRVALTLAVIFTLAVSPAFATWFSFQNTSANNGTTQVLLNNPSANGIELEDNFANSGVDATSVINNGVVYTLYNGGYAYNTQGGARMQASLLSTGTKQWNKLLDDNSFDVAQLSTPVIAGNYIYAATTGSTAFYNSSSISTAGWTGTANIGNTSAVFAAGASNHIITRTAAVNIISPVDKITTEFGLIPAVNNSAKYTIQLCRSNGSLYKTLINDATLYGGYETALNEYSGTPIPAGNYKLKLIITTDATHPITVTSIKLSCNGWKLHKISKNNGNFTTVASGVGSANTPLTKAGNYVYFGIYGGEKCYYQYKITSPTSLKKFNANDDFYWAGATDVSNVNGKNYVVFGSDSGTVYWREVNNFAGAGFSVSLQNQQPYAGKIRSSIVKIGSTLYFTSQGRITGSSNDKKGYLWKFNKNGTHIANTNLGDRSNTTSTPAVADSKVYVGVYEHGNVANPNGKVYQYTTNLTDKKEVYEGAPVNCSPVVNNNNRVPYVYFTANSSNGKGYCYSYNPATSSFVKKWESGGTSNNRFALQGFAADNGYLVYGDDGNKLYILKD